MNEVGESWVQVQPGLQSYTLSRKKWNWAKKEMVTMHHYFYILSKHSCGFYWKPETSGLNELSSISTVITLWHILSWLIYTFLKNQALKFYCNVNLCFDRQIDPMLRLVIIPIHLGKKQTSKTTRNTKLRYNFSIST